MRLGCVQPAVKLAACDSAPIEIIERNHNPRVRSMCDQIKQQADKLPDVLARQCRSVADVIAAQEAERSIASTRRESRSTCEASSSTSADST